MAEQSHRDEMNAAIRAQRARQGTDKQTQPAPPAPGKSSLARLRDRLLGK